MKYRPEIDGLRAVAVLPVILFHAGAPGFAGGYVGVDVFFVISGYLITGLVRADADAGRFSLLTFYERRVRRILPALFLVVGASMVAAWRWLPPSLSGGFAQSVVATVLFSSNLLFWRQAGYFDTAGELKPLLHTWSLSIEEQFYLLYPLLLVAALRHGPRRAAAAVALVAVLSLALAQSGVLGAEAGFFLLPTRAWELMLGALVALLPREESAARPLDEAASVLGLVLIGVAVACFDKQTAVPGLPGLLPTVGTALVLWHARAGTRIGGLLASPPLVGLGLLSYGAYLWHYPMFALARAQSLDEPGPATLAALSAATLALAWLSWRFVEKPFRNRERMSRRTVFTTAGAGAALLLAAGLVSAAATLAPAPADTVDRALYEAPGPAELAGEDGVPCYSEGVSQCHAHSAAGPSLLLLGDSHSADFTREFRRYAGERQIDAWQMSVGGCGFIPAHFARHDGGCGQARALVERQLREHRWGRVVFVANLHQHFAPIPDGELQANLDSLAGLFAQVRASDATLVVFRPRPFFNADFVRAREIGRLDQVRQVRGPRDAEIDGWLDAQAARLGFPLFDQGAPLLAAGCGTMQCFDGFTAERLPLYRDSNHLTTIGAQLVFGALAPQLDRAAPP